MAALQSGIEIEPRPFSSLGESLGLPEDAVIRELEEAKAKGLLRRFGAVFDSASLGFRSTLCAVEVPERELSRIAKSWAENPGITHAYVRDAKPSLWFTLTAREDKFAAEIERLREELKPAKLLEMPALKRFKVHAVFGDDAPSYEEPARPAEAAKGLDAFEQSAVRLFQGDIPIDARLYSTAASLLGCGEERLLALLSKWKEGGAIRRIGAVCRHRQLGFAANAMCVWNAQPEILDALGAKLAKFSRISHCCERRPSPEFPFNIYAMLHAKSQAELRRLFERLSSENGLSGGLMLSSKAELKKSSPLYY